MKKEGRTPQLTRLQHALAMIHEHVRRAQSLLPSDDLTEPMGKIRETLAGFRHCCEALEPVIAQVIADTVSRNEKSQDNS